MKVYFSTSLSQMTSETENVSKRIVSRLREKKHEVVSYYIFDNKISGLSYEKQSRDESLEAQKNITRLKKLADIVVVEVSEPSLAVGQEITIALSMNKPVIALYHNTKHPHILRDEGGDLLLLASYSDDDLEKVLDDALEYAANNQDVRFNFFISPTIGSYLDWISKSKKIPRSVYLRSLIEKDMVENNEYGK